MLLTEKGKPDTTARGVLVELADHAHEDGTSSFPSVTHIEWATGYDDRTIQRALRRLEGAGLICRDGTTRSGTTRWKLALSMTRPDSDLSDLEARRQQAKVADSERRKRDRTRHSAAVSGTQNPGHGADVRDAESRRPGRKVPASGTQNPGVRDAVPPEPSGNHQEPPGVGGTLPPGPPANQEPPTSALGTDQPLPHQADGPGANSSPKGDPLRARLTELAEVSAKLQMARQADLDDLTDEQIAELVHLISAEDVANYRNYRFKARLNLRISGATSRQQRTAINREIYRLYRAFEDHHKEVNSSAT